MKVEFTVSSHAQRGTVLIEVSGPFFDLESGVASAALKVFERDRLNDKVENTIDVLVELDALDALGDAITSMANQCRRIRQESCS